MKVRNVKLKMRILNIESNEKTIDIYGDIHIELLPLIGVGLTIYSNSFRQYYIKSYVSFHPSNDVESLSIVVEGDVSNLWYTRHFIFESEIAS